MTTPREPFPPSAETLAEWAVRATGVRHVYAGRVGAEWQRLVDFLKDERLAAALALWEAVEWMRTTRSRADIDFHEEAGPPFIARTNRLHGHLLARTMTGEGTTLPEAVSALKAKLAEGE